MAEAEDAAELAHLKIEKAVEAAKKAAEKPEPKPEGSKVQEPTAKPPIPGPSVKTPQNFKPRRQITAKSAASKPYLETSQDVEDYLSALRKQLEEAIASNARIEIL